MTWWRHSWELVPTTDCANVECYRPIFLTQTMKYLLIFNSGKTYVHDQHYSVIFSDMTLFTQTSFTSKTQTLPYFVCILQPKHAVLNHDTGFLSKYYGRYNGYPLGLKLSLNPRPSSLFCHLRQCMGGLVRPPGVSKLSIVELSGKNSRLLPTSTRDW